MKATAQQMSGTTVLTHTIILGSWLSVLYTLRVEDYITLNMPEIVNFDIISLPSGQAHYQKTQLRMQGMVLIVAGHVPSEVLQVVKTMWSVFATIALRAIAVSLDP